MPRYFFNVCNGGPLYVGRTGKEFMNLSAAIEEGHREAARVVGGLLDQPGLFAHLRVDVCDAVGNILHEVPMPCAKTFQR